MKSSALTASVLALAFFAAPLPAMAAGSNDSGTMVVAQAGQNSKRIENIRKFLAGGQNVTRLPDDRIQQRLKRAQAFQGTPNLPADLMAALKQEEQELQAELTRRQSAGGNAAATQNGTAAKNGKQAQAGAPAAAGSSDVQDFLASAKPADQLQDNQLRQQVRQAAQLSKAAGVSKQDRQQLRQIIQAGRAELAKRGQGGQGGQGQAGSQPATGDVAAFLQSAKPADQLQDKALQQQVRQSIQLLKSKDLSNQDRQKLRQIMRDGRAELDKRGKGGQGQAGTGKQQETTAGTPAGGAADDQAKAVLADKGEATKMSNADLRKRLETTRSALASDKLSAANRKALRERLAADRATLRGRVGQKNATTITGDNNTVNNTNVTVNNTTIINREVIRKVREDRRPSRDLNDVDLRLRINVFSRIMLDTSYSERERVEWRGFVERDRALLRERLLAERRQRRDSLRIGVNTGKLNIRLGFRFQPDRPPPPRFIFAAEADDSELEDVLAAPPRRPIERRYTVDEVESNPDLRDAVARIEIDTVNFGFGEGFLREEEVVNLDRIAEIMEKILAAHPNEVFMIEGHTDAVGSDVANLDLSRERAKAVKEALVTYYVIPPENLKTVGFGERYLKIPTPDAEAENRRVSVARITALVGELGN